MEKYDEEFALLCMKELDLDAEIQKILCETDLREVENQQQLLKLNIRLLQILNEYEKLRDQIKTESRYDQLNYLLKSVYRVESGLEKSRIITNSIETKFGGTEYEKTR